MQYRGEIDGLRAVAVLPVIFFHAGFEAFSGGFVGVDVFFVISGYLITSIILSGYQSDNFSLINFYNRRARRLLPALYLVLLISSYSAYFLLSPLDSRDYWQSLVATVFFASNILFSFESANYFSLGAEYKPLLHTWSLAVEEQYYAVFPLLMLFIWKIVNSNSSYILLFIGFISFGFAEWLSVQNSEIAAVGFFILPTRGWELIVGALLALHLARIRNYVTSLPYSMTLNNSGAITGLGLILVSIILFDSSFPYPSFYTLVPTLGTALIIICAEKKTIVGQLLSFKLLVGMGLVSYSAYLWHQPLLAFNRYLVLSELSTIRALILIGLTFALAWFSWRFIEVPFRDHKKVSNKHFLFILMLTSGVLVAIGVAGHFSNGFEKAKLSEVDRDRKLFYVDYFQEVRKKDKLLTTLFESNSDGFGDSPSRKVLILGDSLSGDFFGAVMLDESLKIQHDFVRKDLDDPDMASFKQFLAVGIDQFKGREDMISDFVMLEVLLEESDQVVLASNWTTKTIEHGIGLAQYLAQSGLATSIVDPLAFFHLSSSSYQFVKSKLVLDERRRFMYQTLLPDYLQTRNYLKNAVFELNRNNLEFIDKGSLFCDFEGHECQLFDEEGRPFFFDQSHLTTIGMQRYSAYLRENIYVE